MGQRKLFTLAVVNRPSEFRQEQLSSRGSIFKGDNFVRFMGIGLHEGNTLYRKGDHKSVTSSDFRPLPHPFVLYVPWRGGGIFSLRLGQPWPCLDLFPLFPPLFFISFQ